ncbi:MAG TPA: Rrf2 family transcriptional regulator [Gammaproteobacteria bacterium]|nr:Rrf2 family transcriptional regulator [Gammaproteobacteria bacterium]
MQLTLHTDYALRVLIYLAQKEGELATISEITDFYRISRNHLVKVVHHLAQEDFIHTTRGKHGGMCLAREAKLIPIGQVVRRMEPSFDLVECFSNNNQPCTVVPICALKGVLQRAVSEFLTLLDQFTVADAVVQNQTTEQIFSASQLLNTNSSKSKN